jgi:TetR/AcrR family transcriptional regulator
MAGKQTAATPAAGARSILDAATALFAGDGFDAVSIADIAEKAGVSKANIFHHFSSKDDLYLVVMKEASAAHADYAEELYRMSCSSVDKVRMLIEFEIRNQLDNRQSTRLMMREIADGNHARVRKIARNVFQRNFTAVVGIFEQGRECGEFDSSIQPAAAAMLLSGATSFYFNCHEVLREWREASEIGTRETYARHIAELILSGILPKAIARKGRGRVKAPISKQCDTGE